MTNFGSKDRIERMITVTASTSVVLVATSVNAPTEHVVLFPQLSNIGRLITVRDNDGQASLTNPVVMSTMTGTTFTTGNEIRINQPYGFVTVTTQTPTTYSILNTFAFPAEQSAANIQTLNAQTLNVSTIQFLDTSTNLPVALYSSTNRLIYNNDYVGDVTNEELQSTVNALGTIGYLSTIPDYFPIPPVWVAVGISSNNAPTPNAIGNPQGTIQYSTDSITWRNAAGNAGFTQYGTAATFDGKGLFVAVGANRTAEGSNLGYIKWSYNGSNWQNSLSPFLSTSQERTGVSYANGYYHAVGYNPNGGPSTILWSLDGVNYTPSQGNPFSSPSGSLGYATGITYGNDVWVCSGAQDALPAQGSLLWSIDGTSWNPATTACWTGNEVYDVDFNGTYFIALTKDGLNVNAFNIARSTDGRNWSSTGLTQGNYGNLTKYVGANEQQWIVTTNDTNRSLVYSLNDGSSWFTNANIATCNVNMYKPYYDGSKWLIGVQTGGSQSIYYSTDAQTWTTASIQSQFINGGYARGFASSDGLSNVNLLLASTMTGLANNFTTSTLAVNTISTSIIMADTIYSGLAYVSTVFIGTTIVSTTYEIVNNISTQNVDFISAGVIRAYDTTIQKLKVDNLSTSFGSISTLNVGNLSTSFGSISMLNVGNLSTSFGSISTLNVQNIFTTYQTASTISTNFLYAEKVGLNVYNPTFTLDILGNAKLKNNTLLNLWVAVGSGAGTIAYSLDGLSWNLITSPSILSSGGYGVAWNGSMWIAVGSGFPPSENNIVYSYDGINWSNTSSTVFSAGFGVAWNGSMWVSVGYGVNSIAYSYDGLIWTGIGTSIFSSQGNSVVWNGSMWVAVGEGTNSIAYSYDGITWYPVTFSTDIFYICNSVAWNGIMWIAVGQGPNTIAYSYDGVVWNGLGNIIFTGPSNPGGYSVAWNGSMWVAGGRGVNTIAYSYDGLMWTPVSNPYTTNTDVVNGISWNGTMWIAVGEGPVTMMYSYDGLTWNSSISPPFSSIGFDVAYSTNLNPTIQTDNLNIYSQNIPVFLQSTIQILATDKSLILNDSIFINSISSFVGINTGTPRYTLDIAGNVNASGNGLFNSTFTNYISSGYIYGGQGVIDDLSTRLLSTSQATVSSIFTNYISSGYIYGGQGTIDDLSTRLLSTSQATMSSIFTNYISSGRAFINDLQANNMNFITASVSTLNAQNISTSFMRASTISTSFLYAERVGINVSMPQYELDVNGIINGRSTIRGERLFFTNTGSASAPSLSWTSESAQNSGIYRAAEADIRTSINGSDRLIVNEFGAEIGGRLKINQDGIVSEPSIYWTSDGNSGFYHPTDGDIRASINGSEKIKINSDGLTVSGAISATGNITAPNILSFPVGCIMMHGAATAPTGWLLCNGANYAVSAYPALYAVITTTYGGTPDVDFNVPQLQNRFPIGAGGSYAIGTTGGSATKTLTTDEMPAHSHSITDPGHTHNYDKTGSHQIENGSGDVSADDTYTATATSSQYTGITGTNSAGSGNSFSILNPYIAITYIIKT